MCLNFEENVKKCFVPQHNGSETLNFHLKRDKELLRLSENLSLHSQKRWICLLLKSSNVDVDVVVGVIFLETLFVLFDPLKCKKKVF